MKCNVKISVLGCISVCSDIRLSMPCMHALQAMNSRVSVQTEVHAVKRSFHKIVSHNNIGIPKKKYKLEAQQTLKASTGRY